MSENRCNQPDFITGLIEIYRNHPCLWQVKSKHYANRAMREKAYAALLQFYKTVDANATVDTVKNKLNNLRSAFRKELKKVQKSKKSGSGAEEVYSPKLWYFKQLLFTSDQETPLKPISNDSDDNTETAASDSESEQNIEDTPSPGIAFTDDVIGDTQQTITPITSPQPSVVASSSFSRPSATSAKRAPKRQLVNQQDLVEKVCRSLERATDEFDAIGENVAHKLRRISDEQRLYAEQLIHKVLFYAIQNKLNPDFDVAPNRPTQIPATNVPHFPQPSYDHYQFAHPQQSSSNGTSYVFSHYSSPQPTTSSAILGEHTEP